MEIMEIEKWFNNEVLPHFEGKDAKYMRAFYTLPGNPLKLKDKHKVALSIANYAYTRGFSAFIGHDGSLAFKQRQ
jgi:hypothetical protein